MNKYAKYTIPILLILFALTAYSQDTLEMSKEEWEIRRDDYAVQIIILMKKLEGINSAIDSIAGVDSSKSREFDKEEQELYSLVGLTGSSIEDYRNKFEMTESKINSRRSSAADARAMYFDEISFSMARCLPEFSERYSSMKKQLEEWEGYQPPISETKKEEVQELEKKNVPISENQNLPPMETNQNVSKENERTYTVEKGDCLRSIAEKKYNSSELWPLIWFANKDGIVNDKYFYLDYQRAVIDPDRIYPGQILFMPVISQKMKMDIEKFEKRVRTETDPNH